MDIKKEGIILATILVIIYLLAIPLTEKLSHEFVYDGMTVTYKKVKALNEYGVTEVYTIGLKGPVDFQDTDYYITINNTPIEFTKFVRKGTVYYAGTIPFSPTKVNIQSITFDKYSPLAEPVPILFLALSIIMIIGITKITTFSGEKLIKARKYFVIGMILLSLALFSLVSTQTYYSYDFGDFSFTATNTIHIIYPSSIEIYTPFTAKILPLGTTATLTITADNGITYYAYYYESLGYIFTAKTAHKTIWINTTTATLKIGHKYIWQLAAAYTVIFFIFFTAVLFLYSYFIFDILDYEPEKEKQQ